jgi:hypothetical protein
VRAAPLRPEEGLQSPVIAGYGHEEGL